MVNLPQKLLGVIFIAIFLAAAFYSVERERKLIDDGLTGIAQFADKAAKQSLKTSDDLLLRSTR